MKAYLLVEKFVLAIAIRVSLHIAEIADVTDFFGGAAVRLLVWVEVRTSSCASLAEIAELMDVETMPVARGEAGEVSSDESASK